MNRLGFLILLLTVLATPVWAADVLMFRTKAGPGTSCATVATGTLISTSETAAKIVPMNKYRHPGVIGDILGLTVVVDKSPSELKRNLPGEKKVDELFINPLKPLEVPLDDYHYALVVTKKDLVTNRRLTRADLILHWATNYRIVVTIAQKNIATDVYALGADGQRSTVAFAPKLMTELVMEKLGRLIFLQWQDVKPDMFDDEMAGVKTPDLLKAILVAPHLSDSNRAMLLSAYFAGLGYEYMLEGKTLNEVDIVEAVKVWVQLQPETMKQNNPYYEQALIELNRAAKQLPRLSVALWANHPQYVLDFVE